MITVFGADWCEDTRRSLRHLRRLSVAHRYLNIDEDFAALERALALNHGVRRTPIIEVRSRVLVEPSNESLTDALIDSGDLTREEAHDRLTIQNVGDLERALRTGAGVLLVALAPSLPRVVRWPARVVGTVAALSGIAGWCPAYFAANVTSLHGPGDRPSEAARPDWIARALPEAAQ
jgi:glutaredoxin